MEQNRCPCGLLLTQGKISTLIVLATNPVIGTALNSKVYDSRGVLYKHYREKQIGVFQYNCQECEYGNDERV